MKLLIITIGLPQSGKSTWAKELRHPIINRDSLRFALGGTIRYFDEEARVSEIERIMVKALFKAGHNTVIVDATHLKKKYIEAWKTFGVSPIWIKDQERNFTIQLVPFFTSLEECIDRAKVGFPEDDKFPLVIRSMWENAEIKQMGFAATIPEFKT
jgi:predicted kinase